jgi:outer membrane protein assembly factor BamB
VRCLLAAAAVSLAIVACGGGGDAQRLGAASPPRSAATATATQPYNLDDMMGLYAQQTVFVADGEKVSVITLLNHFTRYTIPTRSKAQVASDAYATFGTPPSNSPGLFYVLDGIETGAGRLRAFDLLNGAERASRSEIGSVASPHRALGIAIDGRVLVLKADGRHAWIDAYEAGTLKPLGSVMEKAGCGDRLLVSGSRVAIVCLETGQIAVDGLRGGGTALIDGSLPGLAGAAMSDDGTIYAVTADRKLAVISPGAPKLSPLPWPSEWTGTVLPDTLAVTAGPSAGTVMLAQLAEDGAWLREFASNNVSQRQSLRLAGRTSGAPQFGLVALSPFAYFASGGSVKHVELNNGMLETMTEVGQGATVVAVVNR